MSSPSRTLKLALLADTKRFDDGLDKAEGRAKGFGAKLGKMGKVAAIGIAAAGAAVIAVGNKLWRAGEQAATSNARIGQIAESMGLFGDRAGEVTDRLVKMAEATARQTGIDQNAIKATQAKLLTFGELAASADVVGGSFDRATQAAIDLAAAGFGTAEANAAQLGKALNDPIKGLASLSKSGVTFTEVEKERIATLVKSNQMGEAQAVVLAAIEKQVGGTAVATADGSAKMGVAFSQVTEKVGQKLVPIMDKLATWVTDKVLPAFEQWSAKYGPLVAEWFGKVGDVAARLGEWFTTKLLPAAMTLWQWIGDHLIPGLRNTLAPIIEGVRGVVEKLTSKFGENSGAISKVVEWVRTLAEFIAGTVAPIIGALVGGALTVLGTILGGIIDLVGWLVGAIETLVGWFGKVASAVDTALGPLRTFLDLAGKAASFAGGIGGKLGGLLPFAEGGIVTGPTPALIGEAGPEAVIPLDRLGQFSGGGDVTINVTGTMLDPEGVARAVERAMHDAQRRTGGRAVMAGVA